MGKIPMEDDRGKERLEDFKKESGRHYTCANCGANTFHMNEVSDFPFFDTICSKCGSHFIYRGELK